MKRNMFKAKTTKNEVREVGDCFGQTGNLSKVAQVHLCNIFWARETFSKNNAKNYPICEICRIQAKVFKKHLK